MRNFICRGPTTNPNAHGSIEDEEATKDKEYVPTTCLAFGLVYMVNPETGEEMMFEKGARTATFGSIDFLDRNME